MPDTIIKNEASLRRYIKPYVKQLDKRIKIELDDITIEYLEHTSIFVLFVGFKQEFCTLTQSNCNIVDSKSLKLTSIEKVDQPASLYCLIPGITHGLRINGQLAQGSFKIEQVYFQCGRAMMRSQLWALENKPTRQYSTEAHTLLTEVDKTFIQTNHYALIGTRNTQGNTEISPRGNDSSLLDILNDSTLILKEHPGNKVAISLRNILQESAISLLLLNRSENQALSINGTAIIVCSNLTASKPNIHIKVTIEHLQFITLSKSHKLWENQTYLDTSEITPFAKAINAHMNGTGLLGKVAQPIVNAIIEHDQKHLY